MTRERPTNRRGCATFEFDHARMTPEQFRKTIESLGLTQFTAAALLGVHPRTTRRWAAAERQIPGPVSNFLRYLVDARTIKATRVPRARKTKGKIKTRVGPTFVAEFADGTVTRMSIFTPITPVERLDWGRGERLAQAAWQSRWRAQYRKQNGKLCPVNEIALVPPAIARSRFEQNGVVLAQRNGGGVA